MIADERLLEEGYCTKTSQTWPLLVRTIVFLAVVRSVQLQRTFHFQFHPSYLSAAERYIIVQAFDLQSDFQLVSPVIQRTRRSSLSPRREGRVLCSFSRIHHCFCLSATAFLRQSSELEPASLSSD